MKIVISTSSSALEEEIIVRCTYSQILAVFSVSLGAMVTGFSIGYSSPAMISMTNETNTSFNVTMEEVSLVGALIPPTAAAGGLAGGLFIEYIGRRNTILATGITFIISWLMICYAANFAVVLTGRAISGFTIGIASVSLPVYISEMAQPETRGILGLILTAFGTIGILLCFGASIYIDWSMLAFVGVGISIPFFLLMFLIPETPRWYISYGRTNQARKSLVWLNGKKSDVEPELELITKSHADVERCSRNNIFLELLKRSSLRPMLISMGLMFFQQISGFNALIFYAVLFFENAEYIIDWPLYFVIISVFIFIATICAIKKIDQLGRKTLLQISNVAMIIALFTMGGFFNAKTNGSELNEINWVPLASFFVYIIGYSLGFGPIPWLMMGEILPAKIRGPAAGIATAFNWICTYVVSKFFVNMIEVIEIYVLFWFFGSMCIIGFFFVLLFVPETKRRTLEDIERKITGCERKISSEANIRPESTNM